MNLKRTYVHPDDSGVISLQAYPDGTEPYSGPFRKTTIFVVGYGTEHEQLFRRADRNAAIAAARENRLTFDQVPAGQICAEAAEALFS
jgi:hypothetical protein